jgi:ABC-type bacteriocin/lantibiotic exporter with double-glycine peptidase domain
MVLDFHGLRESEQALRRLCKTKPSGTHPINVVSAARALGLISEIQISDLTTLAKLLKEKLPPIVTIFDEQEDVMISHALVVKNVDKQYVEVLDPEKGIRKLTRTAFETLWTATGRVAIVVKPKKS